MQRRALVADEEAVVCETIGRILKSSGMEALTLTRSTAALEILGQGMFDMVFLDLHTPSPDGIELARQMRGSRFNRMTPIVMISDDQRRTRRVPIQSKVRLMFGEEELEGETIDLSMSGLLVRAPRSVPVGSSLRMSLQPSQRMRPIVAAGSVVRIKGGSQMGIQLHQLTLSDSEKLQEFLLRSIPNE